ncbi:MAG: hypothetical protein LUD83_04750 [Clostridiales bacterium]|nr:hypothetical protein [Clostridiales bacterium]
MEDIPKLYTALAEWLACVAFVIQLKPRRSRAAAAGTLAASLLLLCLIQYLIGIVPVSLWIPGVIVALAVMYGTILLCCQVLPADAGFFWAIAFMFAEFAASLEWQFYSFFPRVLRKIFCWRGFSCWCSMASAFICCTGRSATG